MEDKLDKDYEKYFNVIQKEGGVICFYGEINEVIDDLKELISSLKEGKKDNKTHTTLVVTREGLSMRLDGNDYLHKQTLIMKDLLKKEVEKQERLIQSLKDAKIIIDYSGGGDTYEREVTKEERDRFYKICEDFNLE